MGKPGCPAGRATHLISDSRHRSVLADCVRGRYKTVSSEGAGEVKPTDEDVRISAMKLRLCRKHENLCQAVEQEQKSKPTLTFSHLLRH